VVAVPIGFGQAATRRYAAIGPEWAGAAQAREDETVGSNVAPLLAGMVGGIAPHVRLEATGRRVALARAQVESRQTPPRRLTGPPVEKPVRFAPPGGAVEAPPSPIDPARRSLWRNASRDTGIRWGMVIDLDACTGCSACVVACQAENNIPLVGRDEVRRHREMHWMRIDRYVEDHGAGGVEIVHQPMTCHHCGHAPCETVCPVGATSQDGEGLNQQVYSRCVGTRYCMQNCPFKVRRFNWFDASSSVAGQGLPTNPDVSVRFRGVAEKCTFCAHRITETKIAARTAGRSLQDGDVSPACAQSCPSRAITFGDLNDPASRVARAARDPRAYGLFDALNLAPALRYLAVTRRPPLAAAEIRND
jgi:molybdopterin-containing oxidoreductase family iron-sulfur binding subunit